MEDVKNQEELPALQWLESEQQKIQLYLDKKRELMEKQRGLGRISYLLYLPYPKQVISLFLVLFGFVGVIYAWPYVYTGLLEQYITSGGSTKGLFMATLFYGLGVTALLAFVLTTGGPIKTFIKAKITGKDIVEIYNTSNRIDFVVPKDNVAGIYDIDDNYAVQPTADSFATGPNGRRMTCAIPEMPTTFSPRQAVNVGTTGLDMMSLRVYGIKNQQRQWEKDKTGKEWLQPWIMPLVLLFIMGLILGPFFYDKMGEYDEAKVCRQQFDEYKDTALRRGYVPPELEEGLKAKDPTKVNPSNTGGGVKLGG